MNFLEIQNMVEAENSTWCKEWINQAYRMFGKAARIPAEATIPPNGVNISTYELWDLPSDLIQLGKVKYIDTSDNETWLTKIDEIPDPDTNGTPTNYYKRGRKLGFYPKPESGTIKIFYLQYPDKLVNDADEPHEYIPGEFHQALIDYARAKKLHYENDVPDSEEDNAYKNLMNSFYNALKEFEGQVTTDDNAPETVKSVY